MHPRLGFLHRASTWMGCRREVMEFVMEVDTLPETNIQIAPENGWEGKMTGFLLGQKAHFQVLLQLVSGKGINVKLGSSIWNESVEPNPIGSL